MDEYIPDRYLMHMVKVRQIGVLVACIVILTLGLRLAGIGSFMTVDEENWMVRSGGFWHNLFQKHDAGGAFMTTHPGATLMWISGAGIYAQEARVGFDVDTSNLTFFRKAATVPVVIVISILTGIVVWLLAQIFGMRIAAISGVLLATEPYLVGMSQVVHMDMLLALFMLISVLAFWHVRHQIFGVWGKKVTIYLVLSGIAAGLAFGTKLLPALWLFVFFAVAMLGTGWFQKQSWYNLFHTLIRTGGFLFGIAVFTLYIIWPVLWFTPDVFRSFNKDVPSIITDEHVAIEISEEPIAPQSFYVRTLLGRTTPYILLITVGSLVAMFLPAWKRYRGDTFAFAVYILGFLLLITFVAKKADRYAVPALSMLLIIAGIGLSGAWQFMQWKFHIQSLKARIAIYAILGLAVMAVPFLWAPYTIAYNNPVFPNIRPLSQQGWGEGLDAAAAWLNDKPRAEEMYIATWYPSVMTTYFKGHTFSLSSREDYRVSYIVTYRNMGGRAPDDQASDVLDEMKGKKPVHTVYIGGIPYAWIYETLTVGNFTRHIGELAGAKTVGQLVKVEQNTVSAVEIGFATFSGRNNTEDVVLHIRDSLQSTEDIRTVRVNAKDIVDNEWQKFSFEPIQNTAGKELFIMLESPTSVAGNAVTVRYTDIDIRPGDMILNGQKKPGDIAYRIPE